MDCPNQGAAHRSIAKSLGSELRARVVEDVRPVLFGVTIGPELAATGIWNGVTSLAEEFDIDFNIIPTYEVWGAKPAQRPADGTPQ